MEIATVLKCGKDTVTEGEKVSQIQFIVEACEASAHPCPALTSLYNLWGSQIQSSLPCLP